LESKISPFAPVSKRISLSLTWISAENPQSACKSGLALVLS